MTRSWRRELAYQFQRSTGTAPVLAGLYLASIYFTTGALR